MTDTQAPDTIHVLMAFHDGDRGYPMQITSPEFPDAVPYIRADLADARAAAAWIDGRMGKVKRRDFGLR